MKRSKWPSDPPEARLIPIRSYDLDLPIECDDEYWETGFQQPEGKPSSVAYFNMHLKLTDILAYAMRLIVSIFTLSCTLTKDCRSIISKNLTTFLARLYRAQKLR